MCIKRRTYSCSINILLIELGAELVKNALQNTSGCSFNVFGQNLTKTLQNRLEFEPGQIPVLVI